MHERAHRDSRYEFEYDTPSQEQYDLLGWRLRQEKLEIRDDGTWMGPERVDLRTVHFPRPNGHDP